MSTIDKKIAEAEKLMKDLQKQKEASAINTKILDKVYKESGYNNAADLISDLLVHFKVNKYKDLKTSDRRKPTRVTKEIRDGIKKDFKSGASKLSLTKKYTLSFTIVKNICDGEYDNKDLK